MRKGLQKIKELLTLKKTEGKEIDRKVSPTPKEQTVEQAEDPFVLGKKVYYTIGNTYKDGFVVWSYGIACRVPYEYFQWRYTEKSDIQIIAPLLQGKTLYGKVQEKEDGQVYIKSRGVHFYDSVHLLHNHYYEAIVLRVAKRTVQVDLGVSFDWDFGSIFGILTKKRSFSADQLATLKPGDRIKVIHDNPVTAHIQNHLPIATEYQISQELAKREFTMMRDNSWPPAVEYKIGTEHIAVVEYNLDPERKYCTIDSSLRCRIMHKISKYPTNYELRMAKTRELEEGDTVWVKIEKIINYKKLMYVSLVMDRGDFRQVK